MATLSSETLTIINGLRTTVYDRLAVRWLVLLCHILKVNMRVCVSGVCVCMCHYSPAINYYWPTIA